MSLKNWSVVKVQRFHIKNFIEKWHYSKSINGCKSSFHYALLDEKQKMKGAMFYGGMAMANQWKKFAEKESDVLELRRLCCVDETPKNAESFFIAKTVKDLKKTWKGKVLVSYADKEYGHTGVIYKASNWQLIAETKGAKMIKWREKLYHDKSIRTKYIPSNFNKNQLELFDKDVKCSNNYIKPFAKNLILALKNGDAKYVKTKGKYTFIYKL